MTQKEYDQALIVLCDDLNKIKDENNEIRISSLENGDVLIKAEELAKVAQKSTYNFLKSMGYYLLKDSVRSTREIINYLSSISDEDKIVIINHSDANYFSLENKAQRENLTRDNWVALHSNNELCLYVVGNNEDEYITRRLSHYADKNGIV
ncbi:MAG: hypothetical protein RR334_02695, partial [Clostridia bacterium]